MYLKYLYPLQIFFILKNYKIILWYSINFKNTYYLYINYKFIKIINLYIKHELYLNNTIFIDNSIFNKKYLYYNYFSFYLNLHFFFINYIKKNQILSISYIYYNSLWVERETSEMFYIFFKNIKDSRKLLLNYSFVK